MFLPCFPFRRRVQRNRRLLHQTVTALTVGALAGATPVWAESRTPQTWQTREIPSSLQALLADDRQAVQGLFSPRLQLRGVPLPERGDREPPAISNTQRPVANTTSDVTRPPGQGPTAALPAAPANANGIGKKSRRMVRPTEEDPDLNPVWADLPPFPDFLLPGAPPEIGRTRAPDPEPGMTTERTEEPEVRTFLTPSERLNRPHMDGGFSPRNGGSAFTDPETLTNDTRQLEPVNRGSEAGPIGVLRAGPVGVLTEPQDYWMEAARLHNLPLEALYAVALQESGLRTPLGDVQPWPWTLNCNAPCPHGAMRFANRQAATDTLDRLLKAGWRNIDIGAMQINYRAHARRFGTLDLLDPRVNVLVGGTILRESVQRAGGHLRTGLALYHVGSLQPDNASRAERYAGSVSRWMNRLKQPGALRLVKQ